MQTEYMPLAVLETGGTINGIVDSEASPPKESRVVAWLHEYSEQLQLDVTAELVIMKDSRAMTEADRRDLLLAVEACPVERILIPHGTFTMPETGAFLREHLSAHAQRKTIMLVGSLIPLNEPDSDAEAALEFAINCLRKQHAGVWVAMNNRVWSPAEVTKDPATGEYVARR